MSDLTSYRVRVVETALFEVEVRATDEDSARRRVDGVLRGWLPPLESERWTSMDGGRTFEIEAVAS